MAGSARLGTRIIEELLALVDRGDVDDITLWNESERPDFCRWEAPGAIALVAAAIWFAPEALAAAAVIALFTGPPARVAHD